MTNRERKKKMALLRRKQRSRAKIFGTGERPRLQVFRSLKYISAQIIDDTHGHTLIAAHVKQLQTEGSRTQQAEALGKLIAKKAQTKQIRKVVFDRSGYKFNGRVKAFALGARAGGLEF